MSRDYNSRCHQLSRYFSLGQNYGQVLDRTA